MTQKSRHPSHLTIRLTPEEHAQLERFAAGLPKSTYAKERLFGTSATKHKSRGKFPVSDHEALAQALGLLGRSGTGHNLQEIAESIKTGNVAITPEVETAIKNACVELHEIRGLIVRALGLKEQSHDDH